MSWIDLRVYGVVALVAALAACARPKPRSEVPHEPTPWCVYAVAKDDKIGTDPDKDHDLVRVCFADGPTCRIAVKRARGWEGWMSGVLAVEDCPKAGPR